MKYCLLTQLCRLSAVCFAFSHFALHGQAELQIERTSQGQLIPIALEGFTGETRSALEFDLNVAGFKTVPESEARYVIRGTNGEKLQGQVYDMAKRNVFSKEYVGGAVRSRAHAFSDDLVRLLAQPQIGIARTQIAFRVDYAPQHSEIFIADYDGYNARPMTRDNTVNRDPDWVPGDLELYYTHYRGKLPMIYSHDLRAGTRNRIIAFGGINSSPAVSPDGKKVAVVLSKGGSPDIYVANADGSGLRQITFTREAEASPCWSPDGRTLCFSSQIKGRPFLYVAPSTGGEMKLLSTGFGSTTEPDWSPDGKRIAFTRQVGKQFEICVVPAAGGVSKPLVPGEDPSWAPNSRTLIYSRPAGEKHVLSLLDVESVRSFDVRGLSANTAQAAWSH